MMQQRIFFFAGNVVHLVTNFVFNVNGVPVRLEEAPMTYGAKPDALSSMNELLGANPVKVLNGIVSVPHSRAKHNVVARLFLHAHRDKLYNEIHFYPTRLVGLRNKAVQSRSQSVWGIRDSGLQGGCGNNGEVGPYCDGEVWVCSSER
jgi:hypothetical protein